MFSRIVNLCLQKLLLSGIDRRECSRIDHLYAEFIVSHVLLPHYASGKKNDFILWFLENFVYWNDFGCIRRKINISWFARLITRVYSVVMTKKKSLFGFSISWMSTNPHDLGSRIQSWILLKKRTLRLVAWLWLDVLKLTSRRFQEICP